MGYPICYNCSSYKVDGYYTKHDRTNGEIFYCQSCIKKIRQRDYNDTRQSRG